MRTSLPLDDRAEFAVGRNTTVSIGGLAVSRNEDGIEYRGAGGGFSLSYFPGAGEPSGFGVSVRADFISIRAESRFARNREPYFGLGVTARYRLLTRSGFFLQPLVGYEFLAGEERPVGGSDTITENLGLIAGIGVGVAF